MSKYSQNGEDLIMMKALGEPKPGRILEIGAWHPTEFSNSARLIEDWGFSAVLIEFAPSAVRDQAKHHAGAVQGHVRIIQAAVSVEAPHLHEFEITDDALSAGVEQQDHLRKWGKVGGFYGHIWVPTITPAQILNQFGGFDVISIDTEQTSVPIAKAFLEEGARPKILCVEFDNGLAELQAMALQLGYAVIGQTPENVILERRS